MKYQACKQAKRNKSIRLCSAVRRFDVTKQESLPLQKVRIYFFQASSDWRNVLVIVLVSYKGRAFIPVMKMGKFLDHSDLLFRCSI